MGAADSVTTMPLDALTGLRDRPQLCAAGTLDIGEGRAAPRWVNIVPLPRGANSATIDARDGRRFIIENASRLVDDSNAELERQRGPHPVDKDHKMLSWFNPGGPALAWAERYELREDGIYAETSWLPEGSSLVTSLQYRYTSCNVYCEATNVEKKIDKYGWPYETFDLLMKRLAGFTITNIPALEVYSMASQEHEMKEQILKALGLAETATPEDVVRSIQQLKAAGASTSVDLTRYVPRADHDAVVAQLADTRGKLAAVEAEKVKAEHDQLIKEALNAGKITKGSEAIWREELAAEGGVERFKKLMATMPDMLAPPKLRPIEGNTTGGEDPDLASLTADEKHALKASGQDPKTYLAEKKRRAAGR